MDPSSEEPEEDVPPRGFTHFEGPAPRPPLRDVIHSEAIAWLTATPAAPHTSVITSVPDFSEVPEMPFDVWRSWFIDTARRVIQWVPSGGVAIFFQSDVRKECGALVNKSYLVLRAADDENACVVWHKIVCRKPPGTIAPGRCSYSHMICVSREARPAPIRPGPDVLPDTGYMPWVRAMGDKACRVACRFLVEETATAVVVDPFCGQGSVLAMANAFGLDAIGVDMNGKRCRQARVLQLEK